MLRKLFGFFADVIYVRVIRNGFVLRNAATSQEVTVMSECPFNSARLAVGDFNVAEECLRQGVKKFCGGFIRPMPTIVMHQMICKEGGLSDVEVRVLRELADGAGSRKTYVWQGAVLSDDDIRNKVYVEE